jgi:beta-lactamase class A
VRRSLFIGSGLAAAAAAAMPKHAGARTLEQRIRRIISDDPPGVFGVLARTMSPGASLYAINAHDEFPSASTIKVLVMTTAFYEEERKPGVLRERVAYDSSRLICGSEFMQNVADGARLTVAQLLVPMILVSDNTAANLLIEHFGVDRINGVGKMAGMLDTDLDRPFVDCSVQVKHERNVTTPYDMANLLYLIETGAREGMATIVNPEHCRQMIELMLRQQDRDKIPAGLPSGIAVADKDGELDGTRNDAAIVEPFGDSPFILSVYTKGIDDYDACLETIRRIARVTYESVVGSNL